MARFAHEGQQRHVDVDPPIDEVVSPPVVPDSPSTTTQPDETPPTDPTPASSTAPNFSDLGTTFNDATRAPASGLEEGPQGSGSIVPSTTDLTVVQYGLLAEINAGQYSGATLGHVQAMLSDIATAISAANAAVNGGVAGAEQALRASHLSIINTVNTDPVLANPAAQNGATEPMAAPAAPPAETTAATAPPAELSETGDAANTADITDLDTAIAEMEALIAANPHLFIGLTVDDAEAIVQQIQLELTHINEGDVPLGAEAPMIVADQGQSGAPELANHLLQIWG